MKQVTVREMVDILSKEDQDAILVFSDESCYFEMSGAVGNGMWSHDDFLFIDDGDADTERLPEDVKAVVIYGVNA